MADHVNQVYTKDAMLSKNSFGVKEEQCQEESFMDDKVCISETGIAIDNSNVQGHIWHSTIEPHAQPTYLSNIKRELASHEETEIQNDTVNIEGSISADDVKIKAELHEVTEIQNDSVNIEGSISAHDVKIKFDNGLLYCEHCEAYYVDYCIECGMLVNILNKNTLNSADNGAPADIPNDILEIQDRFGQTGIYALRNIPAGVKFGPFTGLCASECPWEMKGETFVLDKNKSKYLNWMQYVNPTRNTFDQNLHVFQSEDNIYYQSTRQIQAGDELLVYLGEVKRSSPNKIVRGDFVAIKEYISKDVFACTFCCLGFSSILLLAKHKSVCIENPAGKFSIEELTQCPFCKIQLDPKEYSEHHMSFCCERNARKGILPTPLAKQATTLLNRRKRCLRPIYKCEQCKYRTKYQADLKKHDNVHHHKVKIYKCGLCNERFKTKESLKLHVANTHAYVGEKNDRDHATTDYRNTHIKVEQSSSHDQKKIFTCSLCVFRIENKHSLRKHIKTKHLKIFDYKCDKCEYGTNLKSNLKVHIKTKHLKKFDYKCDKCEYGTNLKSNLEVHIKTRHLSKFDFKCDSCEYSTNRRYHLERHIKTKHLREFDYHCDLCEFITNDKCNLKMHINTKHLQKFDYKCDNCEYGTNLKRSLKVHIKTRHLQKFDYKCDKCEYGTNHKSNLKVHIKTRHLSKFDFKCDSCEYSTNHRYRLERHIKTKHLKEFDYHCDFCEFITNDKCNLKMHINTKHLQKFDYKCDKCEYGTNLKSSLKVHIKTRHLQKFDFKCDSCEYETNIKSHLKRHIKTKHLRNSIINDTYVNL